MGGRARGRGRPNANSPAFAPAALPSNHAARPGRPVRTDGMIVSVLHGRAQGAGSGPRGVGGHRRFCGGRLATGLFMLGPAVTGGRSFGTTVRSQGFGRPGFQTRPSRPWSQKLGRRQRWRWPARDAWGPARRCGSLRRSCLSRLPAQAGRRSRVAGRFGVFASAAGKPGLGRGQRTPSQHLAKADGSKPQEESRP